MNPEYLPAHFPEHYLQAFKEEIVLIQLGHKKPWQFLEIEEVYGDIIS